jgi:hypothetical protein
VAPWRARLEQPGEAANGRWWWCPLCFGAEGGRRGHVGRVGQKAEQVDGTAGPSGAGKASWAERSDRLAGLLGRLGRNPKRNTFQNNKNWIFEFTKGLEICTRRFGGIMTQGFS